MMAREERIQVARKGVKAAEEAARRLRAFTLLDAGIPGTMVAEALGVPENTVRRWKRMREEGRIREDGFTVSGK